MPEEAKKYEEILGQMLIVGFSSSLNTDQNTEILLEQIAAGAVGGVLLFKHNISSKSDLRYLIKNLKQAAPKEHPLLVSIDQEGGKVQRLRSAQGFRETASAKKIASAGDEQKAYEEYSLCAQQLKELGINMNWGPVVDLDSPNSPAIGGFERSYSSDYKELSSYAAAFVKAHREKGVLTSLKHFPGHGYASKDSHFGLVDVSDTWQEEELKPFVELMKMGYCDSIMVAHLWSKKWDEKHPMSLSPKLNQLLRQDLAYRGLIVSDDLHMGAIQDSYKDFSALVLLAVKAGHDMLVFGNNPKAAPHNPEFKSDPNLALAFKKAMLDLLQRQEISLERLQASYAKVCGLKKSLL